MHRSLTTSTGRTAALVLIAAHSLGCASLTTTERGVLLGTAAGAAAGGMIGKNNGSTTKGAIIGAAVGGIAGGIIGARMDEQAEELEQTIAGARIERIGEGIHVTFDSGILFDFDSHALRSTARANLRELARSLDRYPGSEVLIAGHTDAVGDDWYNQDLSERRARAAVGYLVAEGVSRSRLEQRGLGEDEPVASNASEAGRQQNRRVEIAIFAGDELRRSALRSAGGR